MEPSGGKDVGEAVQRLSPTAIAAIALALLLLVIGGFVFLRGGGTEDDRLTNAVTAAREDPEKLCSSQATYDLIERELRRVRDTHGNESIFAGSYGWASAGRFHHASTQLKRFLNTIGGFVFQESDRDGVFESCA